MILKIFISLLLFCTPLYASNTENLSSFDNNNIAVLNDNFKALNDNANTSRNILNDSFTNNILNVANGGTGQNFSAVAANAIPYFSATGTMGNIGIGTTGYVLTAGSPPSWTKVVALSNTLFQYQGQVSNQGAGQGEVVGTSLVPGASSGNYRFLQTFGAGSSTYTTIWTTKFLKFSGVNTVTIYGRIWTQIGGSEVASLKIDIGGLNGTVSGTAGQVTPEWKTFTIDVSSLTNGTAYDVTASLAETSSSADRIFCSNIIGYGS